MGKAPGLKRRILAIVLNNPGIAPDAIHRILSRTEEFGKVSSESVRGRVFKLKSDGLIIPHGRGYAVTDRMSAVTVLERNGAQKKGTPRGRGWAAFALCNSHAPLSVHDIQSLINPYVVVSDQLVRQWLVRLSRFLEHGRGRDGVVRYKCRDKARGELSRISLDVSRYVRVTPRQGVTTTVTPRRSSPAPPPPSQKEAPPGTLHDPLSLDHVQFYDEDVLPRVRLSKKRRIYPLIEGLYDLVRERFFSNKASYSTDMGSWVQWVGKGVHRRETSYGVHSYTYTLLLKTNDFEIMLGKWEGFDPVRLDNEAEQLLDDIMMLLMREFGSPFTGPGRTEYANQELEHYDYELGWVLDNAGARADSKVTWQENHRLRKWTDMSGSRFSRDGRTPDVGSSTAMAKELQIQQSQVFKDELNLRTYETVRDMSERGIRRVEDKLGDLARDFRAYAEAMTDLEVAKGEIEKARSAKAPPAPRVMDDQDEGAYR